MNKFYNKILIKILNALMKTNWMMIDNHKFNQCRILRIFRKFNNHKKILEYSRLSRNMG